MKASLYYLFHSGFALRFAGRTLIFDYYLDEPAGGGLEQGVVNPEELAGDRVTVFVSHRHADHFNPCIFDWRSRLGEVEYVLSDDIPPHPGSHRIGPGQSLQLQGLQIQTLQSTDEGVAFLVEGEGLCIYHAGDLNWWHWSGEPQQANRQMEEAFRRQMQLLAGRRIDLAMAPIDPRQRRDALLGAQLLMQTADVRHLVPMHFGKHFSVFGRIAADSRADGFRPRMAVLSHRGQRLDFDL